LKAATFAYCWQGRAKGQLSKKTIIRQQRMLAAANGIELPPDAAEAMEEAL